MRQAMIAVFAVCFAGGAAAQMSPQPQLANPASVRCIEQGGALRMDRRPDGGQFGVCVFADDYQCEEWALFRGECPKGGLRVTGYLTAAGRYCAITGGRYAVTSGAGVMPERGTCTLPDGKICEADALYAGSCARP